MCGDGARPYCCCGGGEAIRSLRGYEDGVVRPHSRFAVSLPRSCCAACSSPTHSFSLSTGTGSSGDCTPEYQSPSSISNAGLRTSSSSSPPHGINSGKSSIATLSILQLVICDTDLGINSNPGVRGVGSLVRRFCRGDAAAEDERSLKQLSESVMQLIGLAAALAKFPGAIGAWSVFNSSIFAAEICEVRGFGIEMVSGGVLEAERRMCTSSRLVRRLRIVSGNVADGCILRGGSGLSSIGERGECGELEVEMRMLSMAAITSSTESAVPLRGRLAMGEADGGC